MLKTKKILKQIAGVFGIILTGAFLASTIVYADTEDEKVNTIQATISYKDLDDNEILPSKDVSIKHGEKWRFSAPEKIDGYEIDYDRSTYFWKTTEQKSFKTLSECLKENNSSTIEDLINQLNSLYPQTNMLVMDFNYVYTKTVSQTINYKDDLGNTLLPEKISSSHVRGNFNFSVPEVINGYQIDYTKSNIVQVNYDEIQSITIQEAMIESGESTIEDFVNLYNQKEIAYSVKSVTFNYVYTKIPVKTGTILVKYVDVNGQPIADNIKKTGNVGDEFQAEQKDFPGYTLKAIDGTTNGKFTEQEQIITFIYEKKTPSTDNSNPANVKKEKVDEKIPSDQHKALPKTGEKESMNLSLLVLGTIFTVSAILTYAYRRYNNQEK